MHVYVLYTVHLPVILFSLLHVHNTMTCTWYVYVHAVVFKVYDIDRDGKISKDDLRHVSNSMILYSLRSFLRKNVFVQYYTCAVYTIDCAIIMSKILNFLLDNWYDLHGCRSL